MRFHRPIVWVLILAAILPSGCSTREATNRPTAGPTTVSAIRFTDITDASGIQFRHVNGATGRKYLPETMGAGVAFLDYDNDGWLDLLFVNSASWPGSKPIPATPALYRNETNGKFRDVTKKAGLDRTFYGMGVAVADFDADGFVDLYITAVGPNRLLRNTLGDRIDGPKDVSRGKAFFQDVTSEAGVAGAPVEGLGLRWKWSASAAWLDYDRDGRLDLFVCNYVHWSPQTDQFCGRNNVKTYCVPQTYRGLNCTLYHNEGDMRFRDVSTETGIASEMTVGKSLGVAVADYNADGWPDIAVANDNWANFLFMNVDGKRFEERAPESGVALGTSGRANSGMGIDAADWRNVGRTDLLIGNFQAEALSLLENDGHGSFTPAQHMAGLLEPSLPFLTFGVFWFDADLDGRLDILAANGHIDDLIERFERGNAYRQRPLLFRNNGRQFSEVAVSAGLTDALVGRGAAYGDVDNDGDLDIAIVSNGERARIYRNDTERAGGWVRLRLQGRGFNREGLGAIVRLSAGGMNQTRVVRSGGSYLSESQRDLTFGLGIARRAEGVEVAWPSGKVDRYGPLESGRPYLLEEGGAARAIDAYSGDTN